MKHVFKKLFMLAKPSSQRIALFLAVSAPSTIWLLSDGRLARPMATASWTLVCAGLVATTPSRAARLVAWLQLVALPWTLTWLASVAITGAPPSNAMMASATEGAFKEVMTGALMALAKPSFIACALLTLGCCVWAIRATRCRLNAPTGNTEGLLFLCLLAPASTVLFDGSRILTLAQLIGPEARTAVPWFSHLGRAKDRISVMLVDNAQGSVDLRKIRAAGTASKQFDAMDGLGVFIVSESLRADAFIQKSRGPWSAALMERLGAGLGMRLPNACAGANNTFGSVPRLLTAVDVVDIAGAAQKPTILAIAKAGGAKTAYINNHEIWVLPESGHDLLQKTASMQINALDEVTVEALADFAKRAGTGPKAAVLHLYGAHFPYEDRYPASLFSSELAGLATDALEELRYQRAAEYGARVLLQAATVLDAQTEPAFLVFTSDHGENLPSDKTGKRFHSGPSNGQFDTTVPVLVLWNRAFSYTGRTALLEHLANAKGLIAHRDVAKAWLALEGMPGELTPTAAPMTWGALEVGETIRAVPCNALKR